MRRLFLLAALPLGASLVVITPSDQGLVVCADRRVESSDGRRTDDYRKLVIVHAELGLAMTGVGAFHGLDFTREAERFLAARNELASPELFGRLEQHWFSRYRELPDRLPADARFVVHLFYLDANGNPAVEQRVIDPNAARSEPQSFRLPLVDGQIEVVREIVTGKDERFADLRANDLMKRGWAGEALPLADARAFAQLLIRATSERHAWIARTPARVSPVCDCALLRPRQGFTWLRK